VLLGCFYAAVSAGLSISFGLLERSVHRPSGVPRDGAYATYVLAGHGVDPLLAGLLLMPVFFVFGLAVYQFYYTTFEGRGSDQGLRGIAFFFGVAFIVQVGLILAFGVDQRLVEADYIGTSIEFGEMRLPQRMLVAFASASPRRQPSRWRFTFRVPSRPRHQGVAQDEGALRLMGANPVRIKRWAFGIATATCALAGALLIIVGPVEPEP